MFFFIYIFLSFFSYLTESLNDKSIRKDFFPLFLTKRIMKKKVSRLRAIESKDLLTH